MSFLNYISDFYIPWNCWEQKDVDIDIAQLLQVLTLALVVGIQNIISGKLTAPET